MKVICIGDSLTYGYKVTRKDAWPSVLSEISGVNVINKGINGDTTSGVLSRFQKDILEEHPSHVIITAGTNDLIWDVPFSLIQANISTMIQQLYYYQIIPVIGIPIPVYIEEAKRHWTSVDNFGIVNIMLRKYRDWIFQYSDSFKFTICDFYKLFVRENGRDARKELYIDGLHPTVNAHRTMAELCSGELTRAEQLQAL